MASSKLKITYTPVHGVGFEFAKMAFATFGLHPFISVVEQVNIQQLLIKQYSSALRIHHMLLDLDNNIVLALFNEQRGVNLTDQFLRV